MELTKAHNLDDADEVARVVAAGHSVKPLLLTLGHSLSGKG